MTYVYHRYPPSTKADEEVQWNWREARIRWLPIAAAIVDRVMGQSYPNAFSTLIPTMSGAVAGRFRIPSFMRWTFDYGCCKVEAEACYPLMVSLGIISMHLA